MSFTLVCERQLVGAVVPCGRRHATGGCVGVEPPVDNYYYNSEENKGIVYFDGHVDSDGGRFVRSDEYASNIDKEGTEQRFDDDEVIFLPRTASSSTTTSLHFQQQVHRDSSWSSTRAFRGIKILPNTAAANNRGHGQQHSTIAARAAPSESTSSSSKISFFSSGGENEESIKSFESGVATGIASSECSFNNNNDDDEARSDTSICEIFNPMEMATSSSLSILDEETVGPSYSTEVSMEVVMSLSSDMCVPSSQKGIHRDDATVAAAVTAPMKVVDVTVAPAPPHQYQPQTAALPTTAQLHQPYHTAPKMTRIQAPIRQSRPPLLPADPTTKYRKIMKTYGFAAIHHVCFATLYQEHQRYVAALAKADPTLAPSPFPFNKELSAQQCALNMRHTM